MANESANSQRAGEMLQGLFQSVNLFSGIPDAVVQDLKSLAEVVQVSPGTEILRQGELNKSLFFLIVGAVDILVDGGHVASLRRKGDLLGEMSVVTKKPCAATIIAKTPVEMIKVDTEAFRNKIGGSYELFEQVLYRVYSMILTDKINITNQKAKLLEDTLDALSRAKNDLTQVNEQMERRLAERAINLRSQMDDLLNKKLKELSSSLNEAAKKSSGDLQLHINKALSDVTSVSRAIAPIVDAFNLEISLKNRNIILAHAEKKPQTIAKMALGGMGVKIHVAGSTDDAILHMQDSKKDLVLIDVGALDLIKKMSDANLTVPVLLMINEDLKEHVGQLVGLGNVPSIVTITDADRGAAVRAISTSVAKLLSPHVFGMERHLSMGVEIQELQVKRSDERMDLNKKMREYFSGLGVRESVLDNASVVTEELLMNAIYDAPTDPSGNQIYNMLPRTTVVELKPDEYARLRFGCDGAYLAVSVEDPFGALSPDVLIKYLESCYSGKAGTLQVNKGGAGRGLHQIVEGSELVVFNVRPMRRTEVIALFNMLPGKKEEKRPMIQYCVQK